MIRLSPGAKRFIQERGVEVLAVKFIEIETGGTVGVVKDISITFQHPADPRLYREFSVDDIPVFIDRKLRLSEDIVIRKQGFWKFSSLYADGLRGPI